MGTTKEPTCEERIGKHLKSRLEHFLPDFDDLETCKGILDERGVQYTEDDNLSDLARDTFYDSYYEDILSVDVTTTVTVLLSTGGPEDLFEFDFNKEGECVAGRYRFKDWFDGAVRTLSDEETDQLVELFAIQPEQMR